MNDEIESVKVEARRLRQSARRWWVEVPDEWYCTDTEDFESFIGGLYHDRIRMRIRSRQVALVVGAIGAVAAVHW